MRTPVCRSSPAGVLLSLSCAYAFTRECMGALCVCTCVCLLHDTTMTILGGGGAGQGGDALEVELVGPIAARPALQHGGAPAER